MEREPHSPRRIELQYLAPLEPASVDVLFVDPPARLCLEDDALDPRSANRMRLGGPPVGKLVDEAAVGFFGIPGHGDLAHDRGQLVDRVCHALLLLVFGGDGSAAAYASRTLSQRDSMYCRNSASPSRVAW